VNRYGYNARGLFIPYALANFFALISVLLGAVSYCRNGVLPDKKFWVIFKASDRSAHHPPGQSMTADVVQGQPVFRPGRDR
jgi:hypothetical protein